MDGVMDAGERLFFGSVPNLVHSIITSDIHGLAGKVVKLSNDVVKQSGAVLPDGTFNVVSLIGSVAKTVQNLTGLPHGHPEIETDQTFSTLVELIPFASMQFSHDDTIKVALSA